MGDIIKIVKDILDKDPAYTKVGPKVFNREMFRYFQMFVFGDYSLDALMELNFECQGCGKCCHKVSRDNGMAYSDGYCPSLEADNKCKIYRKEIYPIQCEIYPFMLPTIANVSEGIGFEESNVMGTHFTYEFGILDDLDLIVADYDQGWLNGQKKISEIFEEVKNIVLNSESRMAVPKWGIEDDKKYEAMFLCDLSELKKTLTGAGSRI